MGLLLEEESIEFAEEAFYNICDHLSRLNDPRVHLPHLQAFGLHIDIKFGDDIPSAFEDYCLKQSQVYAAYETFETSLLEFTANLPEPGVWFECREKGSNLTQEQAQDVVFTVFPLLHRRGKLFPRDIRDSTWPLPIW